MKLLTKSIPLFLALTVLFAFSANAQIGQLVGKKLKEKAEQTVGKAVDKAIDKAIDDAIPDSKNDNSDSKSDTKNDSQKAKENGSDEITPEKVMEMVPKMPTQQQIAEYLCESNRANPRTLKVLSNPTTAFLTKIAVAGVGGYAAVVSGDGTRFYDLNEQILNELGVTQEQFDAMSEEEQRELAEKYKKELDSRYYKTMERLGQDKKYNELYEKYSKFEDEIANIYNQCDMQCKDLMKSKFGDKQKMSEEDNCSFYRAAMPIYYKAVLTAMEVRRDKQLAVAKQIDDYVKELAEKHPDEVYAGLYNQAAICAASYVAEAARVTQLSIPSID